MDYEIKAAGVAPRLFPTETFFAFFDNGTDQPLELPKELPFSGEWGMSKSVWISDVDKIKIPHAVDIVWLSISERAFYSLQSPLPSSELKSLFEQKSRRTGNQVFDKILVGMAPFGKLALWLDGEEKSCLLSWKKGDKINVDMEDFLPDNPNVELEDYCNFYINNDPIVKQNLATNGLPPRDFFDNYMKQFTYRYLPLFEYWDEDEQRWLKYTEEEQATQPQFDYIEEALYDGTHDKLHDGGLLNYHQAGKPKKLAVKWHIKKSEHAAYFWFEDEMIRSIFDRFYGLHPDTKTDFILHFDPTKNKYQLSLYRYGLREPQILPEESYQLIVFKNKFEHFRSKNYNQPRGAWIW